MSNYVKIAVVGVSNPVIADENCGRTDIEIIKDFFGEHLAKVLPKKPDLVVFPEVCDLPYHILESSENRREYLEKRGDSILDYLKDVSKKNNCHIAYNTLMIKEDGTMRNATRLIGRDGEIHGCYEKNTQHSENLISVYCRVRTPPCLNVTLELLQESPASTSTLTRSVSAAMRKSRSSSFSAHSITVS